MFKSAVRAVLNKASTGALHRASTSRRASLCRALSHYAFIHTDTTSKSEAQTLSEIEVSHLEGIRNRGFYLDDIYQHVKSTKITDLQIIEDGKRVEIAWEDGHKSRFHSIWLRHNCHCGTCLPHTTTVLVDFSQIDEDIRVTSATMDGDDVIVLTWAGNTGELHHEGPILTKFLRYNCYSDAADNIRRTQRAMKFSADKTIPVLDYSELTGSDEGLYKWLVTLSEIGICLVKNSPTKRGTVGEVAELISPVQRSLYGEVFDVESSPNPMNAAYTGVGLSLHMDMIHYESPPGIQLLHCVKFDESIEGGGNFFVDIHEVAHQLKREHPDMFRTLTRIPASATTLDYNRSVPVHIHIQRPLITVNHKDEIVSVMWQPMSIAPLQVPEDDVEPFYKAYKQFYTMVHYYKSMYSHRLRPGDMITFNNRRVLHGRREYTETGHRLLQGCYLNISEFQSKVQIFHNKYGDGRYAVRCGSLDWN